MANAEMSLEGKHVVVVGGASGIGFAVADLARAQGAAVVIGSSNEANVRAAVERLPGAKGRSIDLRDEASVAGFFDELGPFDHLVITAGDWGGAGFGSARDLDLAKARDSLTVRFWGVLAAVKHGCRTIAQDGSITLTSGMLTHRPIKARRSPPPSGSGRTPDPWPRDRSRSGARQRRVSGHRPHRSCEAAYAGGKATVVRSALACAPRRVADRGRQGLCLFDAQRVRDGADPAGRRRRLGGLTGGVVCLEDLIHVLALGAYRYCLRSIIESVGVNPPSDAPSRASGHLEAFASASFHGGAPMRAFMARKSRPPSSWIRST